MGYGSNFRTSKARVSLKFVCSHEGKVQAGMCMQCKLRDLRDKKKRARIQMLQWRHMLRFLPSPPGAHCLALNRKKTVRETKTSPLFVFSLVFAAQSASGVSSDLKAFQECVYAEQLNEPSFANGDSLLGKHLCT